MNFHISSFGLKAFELILIGGATYKKGPEFIENKCQIPRFARLVGLHVMSKKINRTERLAIELVKRLRSGIYSDGRIPSQRRLAEYFGGQCARST